jgi:hypothetical protein
MRFLILFACLPLLAQEVAQTPPPATQTPAPPDQTQAAKPDQPAKPDQGKPEEATKTDAKPDQTASPVPSGEDWINGSIDLGYRWVSSVGGSVPTYRSIVNLNSGFTIVGADFTITDPHHRLFDKIRVHGSDLVNTPYETVNVDISKSKLYDFNADYRVFEYFNYLPSYADPLMSRGLALDEQAFDDQRHFANLSLDLLPGSWIMPYVAFSRDSDSGFGSTVFVTDVNEFPIPDTQSNHTNLYRGGLRFEFRRFHATIEEGATEYRETQNIYQTPGSTNFGNNSQQYFGETVDLTSLLANYGIHGSSYYTKALVTANLASWVDFYGQFMFSQPTSTVQYTQADAGNLLLQSQILFYTSQEFLLDAAAKLPHTTASAGAEMRPLKRVRIVESWMTDRLHNASSATSTNLLVSTPSEQMASALAASLVSNYNQAEVDLYFDATSKLMLRGGYRYVWGDASDNILPLAELTGPEMSAIHRNVGLGGFRYRPLPRITVTGEAEVASSTGAYFRTSLYNYQKVRGQIRYQAFKTLSFSGDFILLDNQNPTPGVNYNYSSRQESASLFWTPFGGKYFDVEGSYTRSAIYSNIGYLEPETLTAQLSRYVDDAHIATAVVNIKLPHSGSFTPKLTAGGSLFISSGSNPTSYYQPVATLWLPVNPHVSFFADWRYYGYGEAFYLYEGFHTNTVTSGLRFSR